MVWAMMRRQASWLYLPTPFTACMALCSPCLSLLVNTDCKHVQHDVAKGVGQLFDIYVEV